MMKRIRMYSIIIILLLSCYEVAYTQRFSDRNQERQRERSHEEPVSPVMSEATNVISDSAGKSRLDVSFRIQKDFFVLVRNLSEQKPFPFIAKGEITVEILDSLNNSVGRDLITNEFGGNEADLSSSQTQFVQGVFSFDLLPGKYTIVTEVRDFESSRRYFDKSKKVTLKDFFSSSSIEFSDVIFVESQKRENDTALIPINWGGNVPFGKNIDAYIGCVTTISVESILVTYHIKKINEETHERVLVVLDTLSSHNFKIGTQLITDKNEEGYHYRLGKSFDNNYSVLLHLQVDTFSQGGYEIELSASAGKSTKSLTKPFQIRWVDAPRSLRNIELAYNALEYIMMKDEFREFKSAASYKQRTLFDECWKKKDPTPGTAYNEAMAEYYRRVDYTVTTFSTVKQNNGMKTERGKAYILYGSPTRTEREMSPNEAPREIWFYSSLNKKLIFVDDSHNGDFKLVAIEKL